jgi:hypothetical protein
MILEGQIFKSGKQWLAEIPALDAMTQGNTRSELLEMVQDLVKELVNQTETRVVVACVRGELTIEVKPTSSLLTAVLRRQRMKAGLTVREVAENLGYRSHNAYAAYEMGKVIPSLEKFEELLSGILGDEKKDSVKGPVLKIA